MITTCRSPPTFDCINPYKGEEINFNLTTNSDYWRTKIVGDIYECVLWYFQFRKQSDPPTHISQYLGVMDIDIDRDEGTSEQEYAIKKNAYLDVLVDKLYQMNYHSYRIYLSGTKGYHVYLFDPKLWVMPAVINPATHNNWLEEQTKRLYPLLYTELDMNIYHINKGIRNPLYPHPKTKRACRMLREKNAPDCVWEWLIAVVHTDVPMIVPYANTTPVRNNVVQRPVINSTLVYSGDSIIAKLNAIFNNATVTKRSGTLHLVDSKYCPIKKGDHKDKGKVYINIYESHATIKCHHGKCAGSKVKVLKQERPLTDFASLQETLLEEGRIKTRTRALRVIKPEVQKHVESTDIEWALGETGMGIISAPMGAGKTTSVIKWIEEERERQRQKRHLQGKPPKSFKVMLLVTRITQAMNFGNKYPGMKSYLDVEGSVSDNESSVLCVNSLVRALSSTSPIIPHFGLLILDEIEALIEALISAVMSQGGKSKQCRIWQLFKVLICGAKRVLFMDGILTERTARYLDKLMVLERCNLVQHEGQPDYREYINFRSNVNFDEAFDADCRSGKKVVIVSNSKSVLYTYAAKGSVYSPQSNLTITGDSTKEEKMTAIDPNDEWTKNILGFNTAVGPGASYDEVHYDVMYVICSPISCTPYSLYQMINRIRTLKDKTVKLFILYNEYKKFPSREELKLSKSTNIIKMHHKQNDFAFPLDFFQKVGADYYKLDINRLDYTVLRKMILEEQLVLYHEDDQFIDTLVDYEYEKLRFNDTEYYSKVLFEIIRRNGGVVKGLTDYEGTTDKDKKGLRDSSRMVRKEGTKNYKELALSSSNILTEKLPENIDPEFKALINRYVQLNDVDTHIRWCTFRRVLMKSDQANYERELEDINERKKAVNNTLIYSTGLLESLKEINKICGFRINLARGTIEGGGSYSAFTDKHLEIDKNLKKIDEQLYNSTKRKLDYKLLKDSRMPKDTSTFKNLRTMFAQFGITLVLDEGRARKISVPTRREERFFDKTFQICLYSQFVRMAFSGLAFDTGLPIQDAFNYLKANYKKI